MYFFKKASPLIFFLAKFKSDGVLIENVLVRILNVPILKLFSSARKSSIPSIISRFEALREANFFKTLGLKEIMSR